MCSSHLQYYFDYQPGEVFACVADIGWITGHSYVVYGPLCNGATTLLFDSTAIYPNPCEFSYPQKIMLQFFVLFFKCVHTNDFICYT